MKLLLGLITGTLLLPSAASAETWWLIIAGSGGTMYAAMASMVIEKVPMESEEQCITAGDSIFNSKDLDSPNNIHHRKIIPNLRYMCVLGK